MASSETDCGHGIAPAQHPPSDATGPAARAGRGRPGPRLPPDRADARCPISLTGPRLRPSALLRTVVRVRGWYLWRLPPASIAWMAAVELLVVALSLRAVPDVELHGLDLLRFGVFLLCAVWYVLATRDAEERRRNAGRHAVHVDQTSVWLFSAALVTPVVLVLVLLVVVRALRYLIAHRPPCTFVFTTTAIAAAVLGAHAVSVRSPLHGWLTGRRALPGTPQEMLSAAVAMSTAMAVYFLIQALLVGVARGLQRRTWSPTVMLGDPATNWFVVTTLFFACGTAVLHAFSPAMTPAILPLAIRFTQERLRLEQSLAERDRLRDDAWHDALTGLFNRKAYDTHAPALLLTDQRHGRPTALLFLDIDHFSRWNSRLGHDGGDTVLRNIADVLREHTRDQDLAFRCGGEEFIIMLPDTDLNEATRIAERIRADVAGLRTRITALDGTRVVLGADGEPRCTVSIGVAAAPEHGTTLPQLRRRADRALYRAKHSGRDRVVAAGDPDLTGTDRRVS